MANQINGSLVVSDDVLADLVGYAAKECYGVVGMASSSTSVSVGESIVGLLPAQRHRRGIVIEHCEDGKLKVVLHIILEYGVNIVVVSQNLVDRVKYILGGMAQIGDCEVEVHVDGMKVRES